MIPACISIPDFFSLSFFGFQSRKCSDPNFFTLTFFCLAFLTFHAFSHETPTGWRASQRVRTYAGGGVEGAREQAAVQPPLGLARGEACGGISGKEWGQYHNETLRRPQEKLLDFPLSIFPCTMRGIFWASFHRKNEHFLAKHSSAVLCNRAGSAFVRCRADLRTEANSEGNREDMRKRMPTASLLGSPTSWVSVCLDDLRLHTVTLRKRTYRCSCGEHAGFAVGRLWTTARFAPTHVK